MGSGAWAKIRVLATAGILVALSGCGRIGFEKIQLGAAEGAGNAAGEGSALLGGTAGATGAQAGATGADAGGSAGVPAGGSAGVPLGGTDP